jgi:hypothetical protein
LFKDFAIKEAPLRRLLLPGTPFEMGKTEANAFERLKKDLMQDTVLALPDFRGKSTFELHTDASDLGISAILVQIGPDGKERVLHYGSRIYQS